jgi:hypothetical protein
MKRPVTGWLSARSRALERLQEIASQEAALFNEFPMLAGERRTVSNLARRLGPSASRLASTPHLKTPRRVRLRP